MKQRNTYSFLVWLQRFLARCLPLVKYWDQVPGNNLYGWTVKEDIQDGEHNSYYGKISYKIKPKTRLHNILKGTIRKKIRP